MHSEYLCNSLVRALRTSVEDESGRFGLARLV